MSEHEFEVEPVPGLPERLPSGERMLWQGAPSWRSLALHAFRLRGLSLYFVALVVWCAHASGASDVAGILSAIMPALILSVAALGLLTVLAWLMARSTRYTITSRRVVIRAGVAIPITINIPFTVIESAALREHRDGTGDLPLRLNDKSLVSYLIMWPHVRPWSFGRTQPMLRCIGEPSRVAGLLGQALGEALNGAAHGDAVEPRPALTTHPVPTPVKGLTTAAA